MSNFDYTIIYFLPRDFVISFDVYGDLEYFGIEDIVDMTYDDIDPDKLQSIMKLCIITSRSDAGWYNPPYKVLEVIEYNEGQFNGELYNLTRSSACNDQERILSLFCDKPAKKIQQWWKKYRYIRAAKKIQRWVTEWLYKPNGPMMKKAWTHFNTLAILDKKNHITRISATQGRPNHVTMMTKE